ncbi:hypothetical protein H5410_015924 [Solanum commersonii]|uniref:Uncharacterized protein n=1 Tax=Solanum commersonii TaxID=4109 RepID=A0A9J5ZVV4_SOLCO|nr:hypothetical protein H5410_015924 [Solanum commersonii]
MLGRAEIPWRSVFESKNMEIVEWAIMDKENVKPMALQIAMKVKSIKETIKVKKNIDSKLRRSSSSCACMDYCGCNSSNVFSVDDYEVFALGPGLGAL